MSLATDPRFWPSVRRILRYRQDLRDARRDGFVEVRAFAPLPWLSPSSGNRIIATRVNRDGTALFVKVERIV